MSLLLLNNHISEFNVCVFVFDIQLFFNVNTGKVIYSVLDFKVLLKGDCLIHSTFFWVFNLI